MRGAAHSESHRNSGAGSATYLPGGVLHHLTAFGERPPVVIARGGGSRIWDTEGREYIDYYLGSAALILGHAHPEICEAVRKQLELGTNFYELTPASIELSCLIVAAVPSAELVKYATSGTEAVTAALRIARAEGGPGRTKIVKFEGAYHGSHDWLLWATRHQSPLAGDLADADSPGIPQDVRANVLIAPYNDTEGFVRVMERHRGEIAAVLAEAFLGNVAPQPGFLETVRQVTADLGIVLIFDEVLSGFRLALGGAQERYRIVPDLTALGKSLGGGFPIGALVGRQELMDRFNPARVAAGDAVLHVGTFSGNPISCAAGVATLKVLQREGTYPRLWALGQSLADGLREISARLGMPTYVMNAGPTVDMWFTESAVVSYPDTWKADRARARRFKLGLLDRGIWSPPGLKMFLSMAHDQADIDRTLEAAEASMRAVMNPL